MFPTISVSRVLSLGALVLLAALSDSTFGAFRDVILTEKSEQAEFEVIVVAEGLDFAWDIEVLPDGRLLLSEYDGRIRIVDRLSGEQQVIPAIGDVTERGGLNGVSLHPRFDENQLVYFCYATGTYEANHTRIARGRFDGDSVNDVEVLFDAKNEARELVHYGCRLLWLSDGTLVATLGDRRHFPAESQSLDNHYGTVVRLNDDGSVPADNPFTKTNASDPSIWAYGIRNVQSVAFHPKTGELWASEHGPYGGDEINILRAGRNYGWPIATYGINYDLTIITDTPLLDRVEPPLYYWYPSIAPSSVMFYEGNEMPKWRGDLFVGGLAARSVSRLELIGDRIVREERLLVELGARIRDLAMGPDGEFYILTDKGDGRLLRIRPVSNDVAH